MRKRNVNVTILYVSLRDLLRDARTICSHVNCHCAPVNETFAKRGMSRVYITYRSLTVQYTQAFYSGLLVFLACNSLAWHKSYIRCWFVVVISFNYFYEVCMYILCILAAVLLRFLVHAYRNNSVPNERVKYKLTIKEVFP